MGREPIKPQKMLVVSPIKAEAFKKAVIAKPTSGGKLPDPRLSEVVAALRREMEAVALIAASDDREVPRFHLSEVEMDFSYAVTEVDDQGVRVMIDQKRLAEAAPAQVHRLTMKIVDADVLQLTQGLKPTK